MKPSLEEFQVYLRIWAGVITERPLTRQRKRLRNLKAAVFDLLSLLGSLT